MSEHDDHCAEGHDSGDHEHGVSCREISEFLMAYLERELEGEQKAEFERHLKLCPPCVHYLDGYKETVELVRRCGRSELDPNEKKRHGRPPEGLIQAILAAKRGRDEG
jgi:hypothetical protein